VRRPAPTAEDKKANDAEQTKESTADETKYTYDVHQYEILHENAFTSDRRCMSVIVRTPEGKIVLYAKGNDEHVCVWGGGGGGDGGPRATRGLCARRGHSKGENEWDVGATLC
jgi:hypothetical protein